MIWLAGIVVVFVNYTIEWFRYLVARLGDPDRGNSIMRPGPWLANRSRTVAAWEYAALGQFRPSAHVPVERRRRALLVSFAAWIVTLILGVPLYAALETVRQRAALVAEPLGQLAILGTGLAVIGTIRLVIAAWDPEPPAKLRWPLLILALGAVALLIPALASLGAG